MDLHKQVDTSLSDLHESVDTTSAKHTTWRRILSFFGPAYLISVGYMDPGNWATDLAGGSRFGYQLIWVLLLSNLMALLLQSFSARLGIVRGLDLAQATRETYPYTVAIMFYLLAEIAIAATDLAEVLGMAIGIQLLSGIPLMVAVLITVLDTFLLLLLQRYGIRKMEACIMALIAVIGISFFAEIILAKPDMKELAAGFIPRIPDQAALYISMGIIGATVMPHNLYLHSALVQTRKIKRDKDGIRKAIRLNMIDSAVALNLAFLVNAAILVLSAAVFFKSGRTDVAEIKQAHELLPAFLGTGMASILFAVALIAAGQSSTITGTLAGQVVMEGFLRLRINPVVRRLITRFIAIIPAVIVIWINGEQNIDSLIILSQVILSLQLAFAVIPLTHFVSNKKIMGEFAIKPAVRALAWLNILVLLYLNIRMVAAQATDVFAMPENRTGKALIITGGLLFAALLIIAFLYPLFFRPRSSAGADIQPVTGQPLQGVSPGYRTIAIALECSEKDQKLLSYAMGLAKSKATFILIHVAESVPAQVYKNESYDVETRRVKEQIENYARQLKSNGFRAKGLLGFHRRAEEIIRLTKENNADILVVGAHGHHGMKDWLYGETIESVRHKLTIPVLSVPV